MCNATLYLAFFFLLRVTSPSSCFFCILQLLERSGLTPEVQLIHVGKGNGKLWRLYKISNSKISCEIVEEFVDNVFDLDLDHGV